MKNRITKNWEIEKFEKQKTEKFGSREKEKLEKLKSKLKENEKRKIMIIKS